MDGPAGLAVPERGLEVLEVLGVLEVLEVRGVLEVLEVR
jgi:hypothetical protein